MKYLAILIVIALVLAPVFWMMPSPGQRRQAAMRQRAMQLGLQVRVSDLPQTHRQQVRRERTEQGVVYRLPLSRATLDAIQLANGGKLLVVRDGSAQEWQGDALLRVRQLLGEALENMQSLVALEVSAAGLGAYWRESGGVPAVESLHGQLNSLAGQLEEVRP